MPTKYNEISFDDGDIIKSVVENNLEFDQPKKNII